MITEGFWHRGWYRPASLGRQHHSQSEGLYSCCNTLTPPHTTALTHSLRNITIVMLGAHEMWHRSAQSVTRLLKESAASRGMKYADRQYFLCNFIVYAWINLVQLLQIDPEILLQHFLAHPAGGQMSFCHGAASVVRLSSVCRLSSSTIHENRYFD